MDTVKESGVMQRHFVQELESLKTNLIKMGSVVEKALETAFTALQTSDAELARRVLEGDERVNDLEVEIDHAIIDLLALQQPVAGDLRFILAAQKINNDLERIGDHAVNIAESAITIAGAAPLQPLELLPRMAELAQAMLRDALDGFIHRDPVLGKSVLERDDQIDEMNREAARRAVTMMKTDAAAVDLGIELIRVSKNLERIGDLATNIAEEVIFICKATMVKHHADEKEKRTFPG